MTVISVSNLSLAFGTDVLLENVSFSLNENDKMGIVGINGSGKTTLMNMIAGIYYPDEGHIYVDGEEANIRSPKDAFAYGVGMIHQHFKLVDVLTATENIVLGLDEKL